MHSEPMIAVRDVRASAAWYAQLLGCKSDHGRLDFDRLFHAGRVILMLHQCPDSRAPEPAGAAGAEHGLTEPVAGAAGSGVLIWIYVDDLDVIVRRAEKLGARVVVPPHSNPQAGWKEFTLSDPDGYRIVIVEA